MNIHYIVSDGQIASISTPEYRKRTGERKPTKKGTQPPRTRPGQDFPGGKQLRRAYRELNRRRDAHAKTVGASGKGKTVNALAYQLPGSMKTRAR